MRLDDFNNSRSSRNHLSRFAWSPQILTNQTQNKKSNLFQIRSPLQIETTNRSSGLCRTHNSKEAERSDLAE